MNLFEIKKLRSFKRSKSMREVINDIRKIINTREAEKRIKNKRLEKS
jgi:predicted component of type VI protein secretion system